MFLTRLFTWFSLIVILLAVIAVMFGQFWQSIFLLAAVALAGIGLALWNGFR